MQEQKGEPNSSLALQMLISLDQTYLWVYTVLVTLVFVYKGYSLRYPEYALGGEIAAFVLLVLVQYCRLHFGTAGNKTEGATAMCIFLVLFLVTLPLGVYFVRLQVYV